MIVAIFISLAGTAVLAVVVSARALEARWWRRTLVAYELNFPGDIDDDAVTAWLSAVAAITHRAVWSLIPLPPVAWEVVAKSTGIKHTLLMSSNNSDAVLSALRATIPGARLTEVAEYFKSRPKITMAAEATMTSRARPLALQRNVGSSGAFLASLQPLPPNTTVVMQWVVTSAGTPAPVKQVSSNDAGRRLPWPLDNETPVDTEAVRQQRLKQQEPLMHAVLRLGVAAPTTGMAVEVFGRCWGHLQGMNAPGVRLVRRYLPSSTVRQRLDGLILPLLHWPMLLNSREAAGLSGLPLSDLQLPGLGLVSARQLPPPGAMQNSGLIIAKSNYPGLTDRPLVIATKDRLRHFWAVAPTGSGKSWLLAAMILQDVAAGRGLIAIDVKGDLITDVVARIRPEDEDRVVVLDASRRDQPIGLNVLSHTGGEAERELVVDNVLHSFREIWSGSWGPRTDYILRNALATLVKGTAVDGTALTICEIVPLLTNPTFRRTVLDQAGIGDDLKAFWYRYDAMSPAEQAQTIGPTLNKVDAFTSRSAIRLMLGQSRGVDLADVFRQRKVVLISLAKGLLGTETANLLGALCVSTLWQATLSRVRVPSDRRAAAFAFIDEAQDIVRLPLSMADLLAQARGLGLGVVLANQYASQLPDSVRAAILSTVRTQIAFQLDLDDARLLERRFAPLAARDLMRLQQYEIAMRPCVDGQTLTPVTGKTLPLAPPVRNPEELAARSRKRYGKPRSEVEAAIAERVAPKTGGLTFGRERLGGER